MGVTQNFSESVAAPAPVSTGLLVSLSVLAPESVETTLASLAQAFSADTSSSQSVLIGAPDPAPPESAIPAGLRVVAYTPQARAPGAWTLTATDYLNAYQLMQQNNAAACLLLGPEAQSLAPESLRALAEPVIAGHADLCMPRYSLGPRDGLVNSSILYPTTRALFAARPRYPLAIDLAFSPRMAERLAAVAQHYTAASQNSALIWPVAEAATAGFTIAEAAIGSRALPHPDDTDLNSLLTQIVGSLFAEIDTKAGYWQRARIAYPSRPIPAKGASPTAAERPEIPELPPMLDAFRLAYSNLQEIWSLVLPPNSVLGLKKLSLMPTASFRMPDSLWARIVYDFALAYRLRTLNRGHLLGALTPLYLAWVASHLLLTGIPGGTSPEAHIEALAVALEADKPYLVSRWRWPDRFNP